MDAFFSGKKCKIFRFYFIRSMYRIILMLPNTFKELKPFLNLSKIDVEKKPLFSKNKNALGADIYKKAS